MFEGEGVDCTEGEETVCYENTERKDIDAKNVEKFQVSNSRNEGVRVIVRLS